MGIHNIDIRALLDEARKLGIYKYHVAYAMGINETTLSRWLRREMNSSVKSQIIAAVNTLKAEAELLTREAM